MDHVDRSSGVNSLHDRGHYRVGAVAAATRRGASTLAGSRCKEGLENNEMQRTKLAQAMGLRR